MSNGVGRGVAASVAIALIALVFGTAEAAASPSPDLTITAGSYKVKAGRLTGSATVVNKGAKATGLWSASLSVALPQGGKLLKRAHERTIQVGESKTLRLATNLPEGLPPGRHPVWFCARHQVAVAALTKAAGCRLVGVIDIPAPSGKSGSPAAGGGSTAPPPTSPPAPPAPPAPPTPKPVIPQIPTAPLAYEVDEPLLVNDPAGFYWVDVPDSYDPSNLTPITLFVWMHGCGGESGGDIYTVSPETVGGAEIPRNWISISIGGRDGECWDPNTDGALVFAAIEDTETHFNIDRHRVIIGGYSSGGDLAYRTAFYNSSYFAGLLAENTAPFRDTGSTVADSLAAATTKFPVVHLAHLQDDEYPIEEVRGEIAQMESAGFPVELLELDGDHYDEPGEIVNGHAVGGTDADLIDFLLPFLDATGRYP
jgi:hypothetical protein